MATVTFDGDELAEVQRLCEEFDPVTHHLTADFIADLESETRENIVEYARKMVRGEMVAGLVIRAAGDALVLEGVATVPAVNGLLSEDYWERYRSHGRPSYLRTSEWQYNLGRAGDDQIRFFWALTDAFGARDDNATPMDHPFVTSLHALVDAVHDRLFGTMDGYERTTLDCVSEEGSG